MGLFGCKACEAKDDEIKWLRYELEQARKTVTEALRPGLTKVVEPEERKTTPIETSEPEKPEPTFPGYEPYTAPRAEPT